MPVRIVVIGAGIVGAATAFELARGGHAVTILDPGEPGGPQAASYGNGAWLSPASVVPVSMPGLWRKVPGFLLDPAGPLTIRWRALPRLSPWLVRFVRAGSSVAKVERTARLLGLLLADAPERHAALSAAIGRPELIRRQGLLYVYPDRAAFEAEALGWRLRRDNGVHWLELDADELRRREPLLSRRYGFGVLVEAGAHCVDPGGYVGAIVDAAVAEGARLVRGTATGFLVEAGRLRAVLTRDGPVPCDRAVIAAGIRSGALARRAGDRVPLASERGYHVVLPDAAVTPRIPTMPSDGKMANTATEAGLRTAGQVELAGIDDPPDWRRADILLRHLRATYPEVGQGGEVRRWMGHRPSTPDGLPVIGRSRLGPDIIHAFGHGHVGLAAAPVTAQLAAALATGAEPLLDVAPFRAGRF